MAACAVLFQVLYGTCAWQAARLGPTASLATQWDATMPYVPAMLLPYMSSGAILIAAFLFVPTRAGLNALVQRLALATAIAALVFACWPHRFAWARPVGAGTGWTDALARSLDHLDGRFNQFPSLHVAYALLVAPALLPVIGVRWPRVAARIGQALLIGWLGAMVASTVLTWQHHLADVAGGLLLAALVLAVTPVRTPRARVALAYATLAVGALALAVAAVPIAPAVVVAVWCAACCLSVARAYTFDRADFLGKCDGRFPIGSLLLHAPFLLGYRITWTLVRLREHGRPVIEQVEPGLWVGRRLSASELALLPPDAAVIDLASELPQLSILRGRPGAAFALLDIVPPRPEQLRAIREAIAHWRASGRPVLVHCAMGYRRSREAVAGLADADRVLPPPYS